MLTKNEYPKRLINIALRKRPTTDEAEQQDREDRRAEQPRRNTPCFLPYVKVTSERIGKICRKYGLQPVFHQRNTLRNILMRVKDPQKTKDNNCIQNAMYTGNAVKCILERQGDH